MKRDIPDYHLKPHEPSNPQNWYKAYKKLKAEASKTSSDAEAMLKAELSTIKSARETNTAEVASTERGLGLYRTNAPGPSRRAIANYGYQSGRTGSKGANKMTLMEKIRREARGAKTTVMSRPMHELQKKQNGVVNAPAKFVEDVKKMKVLQHMDAKKVIVATPKRPGDYVAMGDIATARTCTPPIRGPRRQVERPKPQPATANGVRPYDMTEDREARLRALKSGKPQTCTAREAPCTNHASRHTANSLTLDFLETDSDNDSGDAIIHSPRKRQVDEDDEFFGARPSTDKRPRGEDGNEVDEFFGDHETGHNKKHHLDDDNSIRPPRKSRKPAITSSDDAVPILSHKPQKPCSATALNDDWRARSQSPMKPSPTSSPGPAASPRLQATKRKREAHSLFHAGPKKVPRPA